MYIIGKVGDKMRKKANGRSASSTKTDGQRADRTQVAKIQLRGEALDITKKWLHESDVKMHKELSTENETITVPVTREELVIEKYDLRGEAPHLIETMRIPLRKEQVEVIKKPVILEHVSVHHNRYQEPEHIEVVLREEQLHVEVDGECIVVEDTSLERTLFDERTDQ